MLRNYTQTEPLAYENVYFIYLKQFGQNGITNDLKAHYNILQFIQFAKYYCSYLLTD